MIATIIFTEQEMELVRFFCTKYRNYHMLICGLQKNTFHIDLENPCVFWIPQQDGMTGVNLFELNEYIKSKQGEQ